MSGFVCEELLTFGTWQAMERMVARLLEHSGFSNVMVVGGTGDNGADIVGNFNNKRWVIQVKYRWANGISSDAVKEVIRASNVYQADTAIVATNQHFTQDSYEYLHEISKVGFDLRLWDGNYLLNYFRELPQNSRAKKELRSYQIEAVDKIEQERSQGKRNSLVIMATGLGKSIVANQIIANELSRNNEDEILVLAHMSDLVKQLEASSWSQLTKGCSTHLWTDGESPQYHGGVVFATWQSVINSVPEDVINRFGLVIVDEAHHAPSIMFTRLLDRLNPNFLLGLTATPWRGDEKSLSDLFGEPTFSMDIIDGMQRGFLAEVDYRMLTDGINWNEIAMMSDEGYTIKDLNAKLILPDRDIAIVKLFSEHFFSINNPKALLFCRSKAHADRINSLLSTFGINSAVMHSDLPREQRFFNLSAFRSGTLNCLVSVEMLNEGIDIPDINIICFMRVTHSRRIFIQQLGRGLRINPTKTHVLVLDFVADIRRIAAALEINRLAAERGGSPEIIKYEDGRIIKFENDIPLSFFDEYLSDIADFENVDEGTKLKFP